MDDTTPQKAELAALRAECDALKQQLREAKTGAVFKEALENSSEAIVVYDEKGLLVACNKSFRALYAYTEEEARPGVHFAELGRIDIERGNVVVGDEYGDGEAYLKRKAEYRKTLKGSFIVQLKDGRWIRTTDRPMAGGGFVSLQSDVTEMKKSEFALFRAKIEAELANKAKSDFLANISHDLRTPLNAILGFSEMIMGEVNGPIENKKYADYTRHIHESGSHLLAIVNDILDTAKLENEGYRIVPERIDPIALSKSIVSTLSPIAMENNLTVTVETADSISGEITSDRKAITQILNNLIANACRHSDPGGKVTIAWHHLDDTHCSLSVSDNGAGMPAELVAKVGQPFLSHAPALTLKHERGTGLGLYICSRLAALLGGKLSIESTLGKGTRVTVSMLCRLPADLVIKDEITDDESGIQKVTGPGLPVHSV